MKKILLILALAATLPIGQSGCQRIHAADTSISLDAPVNYLSVTTQTARLTYPVYNRVSLAGWIQLNGKENIDAQTVTISDNGPSFQPEHTIIIVKHEPTVTKRDDGTWAITFKK